MDFLEASTKLERIELLARFAHVESSGKERAIALEWIGEIAEEMHIALKEEIKNPHDGGLSGSGRGLQ